MDEVRCDGGGEGMMEGVMGNAVVCWNTITFDHTPMSSRFKHFTLFSLPLPFATPTPAPPQEIVRSSVQCLSC